MSGGPIFDGEGIYAHGVVSKSWEDASGHENFSFGSMIAPSLILPLSQMNGMSLIQLQAAGTEGMPLTFLNTHVTPVLLLLPERKAFVALAFDNIALYAVFCWHAPSRKSSMCRLIVAHAIHL